MVVHQIIPIMEVALNQGKVMEKVAEAVQEQVADLVMAMGLELVQDLVMEVDGILEAKME